jgi:hypothetical protein
MKVFEGEVNIVGNRMIVLAVVAAADDAAVEVMLLDRLLVSIEEIFDGALIVCAERFSKFSDRREANLPSLVGLIAG